MVAKNSRQYAKREIDRALGTLDWVILHASRVQAMYTEYVNERITAHEPITEEATNVQGALETTVQALTRSRELLKQLEGMM